MSIILKGNYVHVTPKGRFPVSAISMWKSKATDRHYLEIPKGGAWTILICGKPKNKWGFYVGDKKIRPLQYFHKYKGSAKNS